MTIEFQAWPKIARLNRDIVITEKLDGTNAAVVIVPTNVDTTPIDIDKLISLVTPNGVDYFAVYAQSRNRFITPRDDNYGFAGWVLRNDLALIETLGEGTHYGEWWGSGIQRGYGLKGDDKRFSLFNTGRWTSAEFEIDGQYGGRVPGLGVVPVLYYGPFDEYQIKVALLNLEIDGSHAAPRFDRPEGIVIWHEAARQMFKVTLVGDEAPKKIERSAHDLLPEAVAA